MRKLFYSMLAAVTLLASCQKDANLEAMETADGMVDVTVSATMEGTSATTRATDDYGTGETVDRCIMEVYTKADGMLYKRMVVSDDDTNESDITTEDDGTRKVTFNLRLVASQTYDFLFWADKSKGSTDYADNYYSTENRDADGTYLGLKGITASYDNYKGNDETRDAFFGSEKNKYIDASVAFPVTLTRPFGQLNVLTYLTDVPSTMYPKSVLIESTTSLADTFDVSDGSTSTSDGAKDNDFTWSAAVESIHYTDTTDNDIDPMHLSTDYIFAPATDQQLVNFDMTFYSDAAGQSKITKNDNFKNIPIQRNYRTNVSGELLTKQGTINVTIKPAFENDNIDQTIYEVATIAEAEAILAAASEESVYIKITEYINGAAYLNLDTSEDFDDSDDSNATSIDGTVENITLDFANVTANAKIYIGKDLKSGSNISSSANASAYTETLNVITGDTGTGTYTSINSIYIYAEYAHVTYTGYATNGTVITSQDTFVLVDDSKIGTLTVDGGNVEVHGTVGDDTDSDNKGIIISKDNKTTTSIDVYDGGKVYDATPAEDSSLSQSITITTYDSGEVTTVDSSFTIVAAVSEGATAESVSSTFTSFLSSTTTSTLTLTEDITLSGDKVYTATNIDKTIITSGQIILDGTTTLTNVNVNYTGTETFIVPAGATINTLTITSGNVEIYGTVGVVEIADDNQVEVTITIYDGGTITTEIDDPKFTIAIPTTVSAYNDLLTALSGSYTEITLAGDIDLDSNTLSIGRAVTIKGAGFSISGGIFTVDSSDVVIEDLTITDMSGYAVTVSEDASLSATNLTTSGNASGGVYLSAASSSFTLVSGTIGDAPQIVLADTSASVTTPSGETWYSGYYDFSSDGTNIKYIYSQTEFDYYTELVGSGTSTDPYIITMAQQMANIAATYSYLTGVYYKLAKDIDLGCDADNQWTPMGSLKDFRGVFDGDGHTISGLYIDATARNKGLFDGISSTAVVKNLIVEGYVKVDNYTSEGSGYTSSVAGIASTDASSTTIINCISKVTVEGSNSTAGGIVSSSSGTIVNCANIGSIKASNYVGGIAGFNTGKSIYNCYNVGSLSTTTSSSSWLGGIIGFQNGSATTTSCYYSSTTSKGVGMNTSSASDSFTATSMTATKMQDQDFVDKLNDNVKAYNDANPTEKACGWKLVDGDYPTLDFNYFPISE